MDIDSVTEKLNTLIDEYNSKEELKHPLLSGNPDYKGYVPLRKRGSFPYLHDKSIDYKCIRAKGKPVKMRHPLGVPGKYEWTIFYELGRKRIQSSATLEYDLDKEEFSFESQAGTAKTSDTEKALSFFKEELDEIVRSRKGQDE